MTPTTPQRPAGVTAAAVISILGSTLSALFAVLMLLASFLAQPQSSPAPYLKILLPIEAAFFLGLAAWGITTAVGLFRLRPWARVSTIVFSLILAIIGGSSALAMAFMKFPPTQGAPPELLSLVKIGLIAFYLVLALLGAWWLYYFNTAAVRGQFGALDRQPGGRPLSISIIACTMIIGALICLIGVFLPFPAMVFGFLMKGWMARLFFLIFAAVQGALAFGLLRLQPLARVLAVAFYGYGILSGILFALLPGYPDRIRLAVESLPAGLAQASQAGGSTDLSPARPMMVIGALICFIPIWFLVARRHAFTPGRSGANPYSNA